MQPNQKILDLIQEAETGDNSRELSTYNKILQLGLEDGIVVENRFYEWFRVGVSRFNREGLIASRVEALEISDNIDGLGFDPSLIKDATAFQEGPWRSNVQPFMEKVEADPMLPRYDANFIEISSVACSHFNISLGQADQCMEHTNERFTLDGKLNNERIKQSEPGMTEVIDSGGIRWSVWLWPAQHIYPGLMQLSQRAFNAKMQITQGISNFELYSRASNQLQNPTIRAKDDPKTFVQKNLAKLKTRSSELELTQIVHTAAKYGGIPMGPYTRHVSAYKKKSRIVPAGVWTVLAYTKFEHVDLAPHFVQSVLMTCASSPEGVVTGKDIKKNMVNNKETMAVIEEMIEISINMLKGMQLDRATETKEVSQFRCSLVLKFLDKVGEELATKSYFQIAVDFYESCKGKVQNPPVFPFEKFRSAETDEKDENPAPKKRSKNAQDSAAVDSRVNNADNRMHNMESYVVEYGEDGKSKGVLKDVLASKGFVSGVYIEKKKDKDGIL